MYAELEGVNLQRRAKGQAAHPRAALRTSDSSKIIPSRRSSNRTHETLLYLAWACDGPGSYVVVEPYEH
jgi:hypothetical protein